MNLINAKIWWFFMYIEGQGYVLTLCSLRNQHGAVRDRKLSREWVDGWVDGRTGGWMGRLMVHE